MPVIQLPRDTRWGDLGAGLGGLLGQVVQQVQQRQTANAVGQIWSDPNVPDDQKLIESLRRYGDQGGQIGLQIMRAKTLAAQLRDVAAQTQLRGAQAGLAGARTQQTLEQLPYAAPLEQAKIGKEQAQTQATQAEVPLRQAQTQAALAEPALRQAQTREAGAREAQAVETAGLRRTESDIKNIQLQQTQKALEGASANTPLDAALTSLPGIDDTTKTASKAIYNGIVASGGKPEEGMKAALQYAQRQTTTTAGEAATIKEASESASSASSIKRFINAFSADVNQGKTPSGLASGAPFKAWLEGKGFGTGDVQLLTQLDTSLRAGVEALRQQGGGFFSQGRWKIAKDVAPGLMDSPLRNVINLDVMSDTALAKLRSLRSTNPPTSVAKQVDNSISDWEDIKREVGRYQTYTTPKGTTVVTHDGSALNPRTFATLIGADKQYKTSDGKDSFRGADIVAAAADRGMDPLEYARAVKIEVR